VVLLIDGKPVFAIAVEVQLARDDRKRFTWPLCDPMYLSAIFPGSPQWHSDPSVGRTWQNRSFTQEQKLPCADFFHRLVRHCLLARIDELAAENAVAAATLEPRRQADA